MSEKFQPGHHGFENPSLGGPATPYYDSAPSAPPCYEEATAGGCYVLPQPLPIAVNPIHTVQPAPAPQGVNTQFLVGPQALRTTCPSCNKHIISRTVTKNNMRRYVCCLLMFCSGVCLLCSCLPFCMCPAVRVNHFCPHCRAFLGTYVDS